jgi:hypothetical protein
MLPPPDACARTGEPCVMTTAIVTGFTVNTPLLRKSFAPLLSLHRTGLIDRIVYMTWDTAANDGCVAPVREWPEVELVRVPQPNVTCEVWHSRGFIYQSRNIAAALDRVTDPDELVFKTRPGFLIDETVLANKIASFDKWGTAPDFSHRIPIPMPPSPFKSRIWVPWGDAGSPFFFEDAAFMGRARDLRLLVNPLAEELVLYSGDAISLNIAHVMRYIMPFLDDWPIFRRYLRDFALFRMELHYRRLMAPLSVQDPYYWHLAIAHAWILNSSFHIDCGRARNMNMVGSASAKELIDRPIEEIDYNGVYKDLELWRQMEQPGTFLPILMRPGCRLVDDDWQYRLFSGPVEQGFTHENLLAILANLNAYNTGVLHALEENYYAALNKLYCDFHRNATFESILPGALDEAHSSGQ